MDIKRAELAAFIKAARLKKKCTLQGLADVLSVGANTVCRWESGESLPTAASFATLVRVLDLDDKAKLAYAVASGDDTMVNASYDPETQFGKWLKQQRLLRGWNQRMLADELHVAPGTISLWESETTHPCAKTRDKVIVKLLESEEELAPEEPETEAVSETVSETTEVNEVETLNDSPEKVQPKPVETKVEEITKAIEDTMQVVPSNRQDVVDTLLGIAQMLKHLADLL